MVDPLFLSIPAVSYDEEQDKGVDVNGGRLDPRV